MKLSWSILLSIILVSIVSCGGGGGVTSAPKTPAATSPNIIVNSSYNVLAFNKVTVPITVEFDQTIDQSKAEIAIDYDEDALELVDDDSGLIITPIVNQDARYNLTISVDDKVTPVKNKTISIIVAKNHPPEIVMQDELSIYPSLDYEVTTNVYDESEDVLETSWSKEAYIKTSFTGEGYNFTLSSLATSTTESETIQTITFSLIDLANNVAEHSLNVNVFNDIDITDYQVSSETDGCAISVFGFTCWGVYSSDLNALKTKGVDPSKVEAFAFGIDVVVISEGKAYSSGSSDVDDLPLHIGNLSNVYYDNGGFLLVADNHYISNVGRTDMEIVPIDSVVTEVVDNHIIFEDGTFQCLGAWQESCLSSNYVNNGFVSAITVSENAIFAIVDDKVLIQRNYNEVFDSLQVEMFVNNLGKINQIISNPSQDNVYFVGEEYITRAKFINGTLVEYAHDFQDRNDLSRLFMPGGSRAVSGFLCALNEVNRLVCKNHDSSILNVVPYLAE